MVVKVVEALDQLREERTSEAFGETVRMFYEFVELSIFGEPHDVIAHVSLSSGLLEVRHKTFFLIKRGHLGT
jgi:hypothetical protein